MGLGRQQNGAIGRRERVWPLKLTALALCAGTLLGCDSQPLSGGAGGTAGLGGIAGLSGAAGAGGAGAGGPVRLGAPFKTNVFTVLPPAGAAGSNPGGGAGGGSSVGGNGASGSGGVTGGMLQCIPTPPSGSPPAIAVCGDGFRAATEECDDANTSDADSCSSLCKVRPELIDPRASSSALPLPSRSIGASRHPLAAGCNRVGVSFVDQTSNPPALDLSIYSNTGALGVTLQYGVSAVDFPDPAVAALPGDTFAVAWTDLDGDGDELGIRLRRVDPDAPNQNAAIIANESTAFSQSAPDAVFDGNELVVAWMDSSNPATAPDLQYRLFAPDLTPLTGDLTLARTAAVEGDVALAASNGSWAAAWRSGASGMETIEVQSGSVHWTVGPFLPGLAGDRPDLTFLDATHLALAFTEGTDPNGTGVANVSRLHGAILDAAAPGAVASFAIPPAQDPYANSPAVDQSQPALALFPDHLLVSWRSGAVPGDAKDGELWTRRVPFTLAADHSLTIDPSHVEVPLVRSDAQRAGDQSAFRLLSTHLWPSGGLVAAWNDQGRSFHNLEGTPDVALQFLPDLPESQPAVTTYPLSADGKYYNVNVLRRNYPPPTANATFANDAAQFLPQFLSYNPPVVFDGDDSDFLWTTPTHPDLDATATMVVDMGQYLSVGAIRTVYYRGGGPIYAAVSHQIRVATTLGNWTTVIPMSTPPTSNVPTSFDAITARYIQVTSVGTVSGTVAMAELFVYPSAQTSPPPTSADGYDLGNLATNLSRNSNLVQPGNPLLGLLPETWWPVGQFWPKTTAQGATGDGIGIVDLGAQYAISRVDLCFFGAGPWANGGRLDVAAIPDTYTTIYDSGPGSQFGPLPTVSSACQDYRFPPQPVRYIRVTSYYVAAMGGADGNILWSVQAFTNPPPHKQYFPLSPDGKYFAVNIARPSASSIHPIASVAYANGAVQHPTPAFQDPAAVLDGDDNSFAWVTPGGANPNATATLTVDLGQVESLGGLSQVYGGAGAPVSYSVRVAQTLGSWTQVIADTPITPVLGNTFTASFAATPGAGSTSAPLQEAHKRSPSRRGRYAASA